MGCTRIFTPDDHRESMKSLGRNVSHLEEPLTKERREAIRAALHRSTSSKTLLEILENPEHRAFHSVKTLLVKSLPSEMTAEEKEQLPDAYRVILKDHPSAMGLFMQATSERAPGQSAVQHHYEILSTAALIESKFQTKSGKMLSIDPVDRVDFGMKMAAGHTQPKRFGTLEADVLVHKNVGLGLMFEKTVGIDAKYSKTGQYGANKAELERQLKGIRTGFRDGKIDEFIFVTNGVFAKNFNKMVEKCNAAIVRDVIEEKNLVITETPREFLTAKEKNNLPSTTIPESILEDKEKIGKFVSRYEIPQIDLCEHVTFKKES